WLAMAYERQGKMWQAGEQYRSLCQVMPPDEEALLHWVAMLSRQSGQQESLKRYQNVKELWETQGFSLSSAFEEQVSNLQQHALPAISQLSGVKHSSGLPLWTGSDALSSLSAQPYGALEHVLTLGEPEPLHISKETLPLFATLMDVCRRLSEGNELRIAEQVLWTFLPKIELLAQLVSEHQKQAAHIASQGNLLAASLVGHKNDLLGRLRYSKRALHYGESAGDLNLQIVAIRQIAISFDYMDCPDKVIEVSQQTFPKLKAASPLLQACIYASVSGAYAEMRQEEEMQRFMDLAYEHFPDYPEREPDYLHTVCRYSTLIQFDGLNSLSFGEPRKAETILARIDGLHPTLQLPERVRIEVLNYQIAVFIALNSLEQACSYLEAATRAARSLGSERHFREEFSLFRQMQKIWHREPRVQNLADLFLL
ncbi:MAG: hypothetical protein ACRDHW_03860, partial [Ktedonobacteraceae bacterium]